MLGVQGAGRQEIKGELASVGWKEKAVLKDTFARCSGRVGPHKTICQDEAESKDTWLIF